MESNQRIVRCVYDEIINEEKHTLVDEVYSNDVIVHDPLSGTHQGIEAFRQLLGIFDTAFPHHRVEIEAMVTQDDLVAVLHTHTATHGGPFLGLPATGRQVVVSGMELFRVRDGKIVEFWRRDDDAGLLMQIGLLAPPVAAPPVATLLHGQPV